MNKKGNVKIFKLILLIMVLLISIGIILYLFPVMKNLSTIEGQVAFKEKVNNSGVMGLLLLFGLQVAQTFLIIVPGEPIEILSGMCYRKLWWSYNNVNRNINIKYNYSVRSSKSRKKIYNGIYK